MVTAALACRAALEEATGLWPRRSRASDGILPSAAHTIRNPLGRPSSGFGFPGSRREAGMTDAVTAVVGAVVRTPAGAGSLTSIAGTGTLASKEVVPGGRLRKVTRVHAAAVETCAAAGFVMAEMVDLEARPDRTLRQLVAHPMGSQASAVVPATPDHAVSVALQRPEPRPAVIRSTDVDLLPETISQRSRSRTRHALTLPSRSGIC